MTLRDFLNDSRGGQPAEGAVGAETDWMPVALLELTTGRLWIGDTQFAWAEANEGEGCVVEVPPGDYRVEAKGIDFEGSRFVSRMRVLREGSQDATVGDVVGEVKTDSAQIGVADQIALKAAFDAACGDDGDAAVEMLEANTNADVGIFQPDPRGDTRLVYMWSGHGDGGYSVMQLLSGGQCVGIECEFIDASKPY